MFNHLFNTYEAVTPPPKKDFQDQIYQKPEDNTGIINSLDFSFPSEVPQVDKPSDQPFIPVESFDETDQTGLVHLTNNQIINNVINMGRSFVGSRYTYGGSSPNTGFISHIYRQNGIDLPIDTSQIFRAGKEVSLNKAQPGDIICYRGRGPLGRHVQMISRIDPENNQIYVIGVEGSKHEIVEEPLTNRSNIISIRRIFNQNNSDPFLTNQDLQSPTTTTGRFNNREDFIRTLNAGYRRALSSKGLDPNYSYILTAQAAMESGWGKHLAGKYNFGGVKISDREAIEHPERANRALTTDWNINRGYFRHYQNFRNFSSIDDYCNYRINLLSNNRYNAFNSVGVENPYNFVFHILSKGYGSDYGGPESRKYVASVMKNYNTVLNTLRT